ncbi:arginine--tRNA ligase, partial [Omnitrophica bacterium]|nr:arginine--tRNA ligase [Candidatus Omnitrophota bacterium]
VDLKKDSLLQESRDKQLNFCRRFAAKTLMDEIKQDLQAFGVVFDNYFSEQTLYQKDEVKKTFEDLDKKGYLYESDGALWFRSTDFGDDKDRVVRKSSGDFTYLAPDIAYHRTKFDRGFNCLVDLLGPDHHGYTARLKAACQALGHNAQEIEILIVQLVTLFRQGEPVRMSTRAGEFVTLRELMDEVGKDAARFFFIMRRVESHLDFDLDLAKAKTQDNPVYYLQYAHARIASILRFSKISVTADVDLELLKAPQERELIKKLSEYPDILIRAGKALEPYCLADYLRDIAASFHRFYQFQRVVSEDDALTRARLLLCDATRIVLRNGLDLLGISQPESM